MNDETPLTLNLSVQKVNLILTALSQLPYAQVALLIGEIKTMSEAQIQQANAPSDAQ